VPWNYFLHDSLLTEWRQGKIAIVRPPDLAISNEFCYRRIQSRGLLQRCTLSNRCTAETIPHRVIQ
jgi:hypothetical protein